MAQYLCICVGAYWFSAMSFSKWPPGGHTGFLVSGLCRWHGFWSVSQVCFGILLSNFIYMLMVVIGRSLLICCDVAFKMADLWPYRIFWPWISTPNLSNSLLIFSNFNFKMAARWPYWISWFPDSNFSLALNINSKLKWNDTYIYG